MNHELQEAMARAGETADSLAAQVGVDPKTAARWITPGRIPRPRHRFKIASILNQDVEVLWPDVLRRSEPAWLRAWVDWERESVSLRWFELAWIPGLLQTEAYARATLAGEALTAVEVDQLVSARVGRQAIMHRERPPQLTVVIDGGVLRRTLGADRAMMAEQLGHVVACAEMPHVQVHVVPHDIGLYPGLGGPFILADLPDGARVAHADSQARVQILDRPEEVATLGRRWERIRGEALSRMQSLNTIKEAASSWQ